MQEDFLKSLTDVFGKSHESILDTAHFQAVGLDLETTQVRDAMDYDGKQKMFVKNRISMEVERLARKLRKY